MEARLAGHRWIIPRSPHRRPGEGGHERVAVHEREAASHVVEAAAAPRGRGRGAGGASGEGGGGGGGGRPPGSRRARRDTGARCRPRGGGSTAGSCLPPTAAGPGGSGPSRGD